MTWLKYKRKSKSIKTFSKVVQSKRQKKLYQTQKIPGIASAKQRNVSFSQ